jgi:hypothetical protein
MAREFAALAMKRQDAARTPRLALHFFSSQRAGPSAVSSRPRPQNCGEILFYLPKSRKPDSLGDPGKMRNLHTPRNLFETFLREMASISQRRTINFS